MYSYGYTRIMITEWASLKEPLTCVPRPICTKSRAMRSLLYVASALLFCACRASEVESDVPGAKFNKDELEAILKKEHSDRVSNIFDSENGIQHRCLSTLPSLQQPVRRAHGPRGPPVLPRAAPPGTERGTLAVWQPERPSSPCTPLQTSEQRAAFVGRYTWDVDNQELCAGVDGKCSKEEL